MGLRASGVEFRSVDFKINVAPCLVWGAPPPPPEQLRRGWDLDYTAPGAHMISIGRSLDRFKRGSDARLSFLKARRVEFSYGARTICL